MLNFTEVIGSVDLKKVGNVIIASGQVDLGASAKLKREAPSTEHKKRHKPHTIVKDL